MTKQEFVSWIADEKKRQIDTSSCPHSRGDFLRSLMGDPNDQVVKIYSEIYNWKALAEGETVLDIEPMDENDDKQVAQRAVDKLLVIFAAEISRISRG